MKSLILLSLIIIPTAVISQDVTRVSEFKTSTFMGKECDDTEYRNEWGRPNWKNYGQWLSECDSIQSVSLDKEFAERRKRQQEEERIAREKEEAEVLEDLDLDAMWENTVWVEIQDVADSEAYETEYITAVAGVRGAEAEDEALEHLYYRKSMKGLSRLELQKALGKLINKRDALDKNHLDIPKLNSYIKELRKRLKNV